MVWLLIEAAAALAIGVFIVWWTWPKSRRSASTVDDGGRETESPEDRRPGQ
jgi:hypothetical protein